ncbi:hypothetical protein B7C51_24855 (plasmid) [Paenibacillus larvae subsp. pulvifaciens]|uniref:Uncharacterized protein n=1 Tax=Paenibacillus larvae subsp. pulvifaciens TaxID=1477 RepID=A0A1V0UZV5_9BACL|nr:hypothetical protein [Paenibacillus larvae]ARF70707.1 hypothetical protein B7C51_24855 [Paenibacillus larvae subsp. pulvifaciens]
MKEEIKLRPEVQWFAEQMELKLRENDHKGGWADCLIEHLLRQVPREYRELLKALLWDDLPDEVIREAADIANYAMMIADRHRNWEKEE